MREILFRGKRIDNGKWIKGFYYERLNPFTEDGHPVKCFIADVPPFANEIYQETNGQFTGMYDKNGKKVFEGDVLKISRKMDGTETYYIPPLEYPVKVAVKWDMCAWMWETIEQDRYYISFPDAWCHFDCEVVGNIHDNPELLQGGNR